MYNRVNKMYLKNIEELEYLKEEFESRNSLQEEFIQNLVSTLKKNGITEFDVGLEALSGSAGSGEKFQGGKDNPEFRDKVEEEDGERPPLKIYPWWRPSKSMTTIVEEDESCEADDEG